MRHKSGFCDCIRALQMHSEPESESRGFEFAFGAVSTFCFELLINRGFPFHVLLLMAGRYNHSDAADREGRW